jgi:hypothetical protein
LVFIKEFGFGILLDDGRVGSAVFTPDKIEMQPQKHVESTFNNRPFPPRFFPPDGRD